MTQFHNKKKKIEDVFKKGVKKDKRSLEKKKYLQKTRKLKLCKIIISLN